MSDAEFLLLLVAAIYLSECAAWLPRSAIVFQSRWARRWRATAADQRWGNVHGGLVFGNPLPPLGRWVMCQAWPLALSPDGACPDEAESFPFSRGAAPAAIVVPWDQVVGARQTGKQVWVGGRAWIQTASVRQAASLAALLNTLAAAPASQRPALIETALSNTADSDAVGRRLAETSQQTGGLQWSANLLWAYLFTAGPLLVWSTTAWMYWPWLLAALALAWWPLVWQFARAHRALYPDDRAGRLKHVALMLASPVAAIRAHDVLWRESLAGFHPLAIARAILCPQDFAEFARRELSSLKFQPAAHMAAAAPATVTWFRERQWRACVQVVEQAGINVEELLAPPTPEDAQCRTYCPRCRNQFVLEQGVCEACSGIRLVQF